MTKEYIEQLKSALQKCEKENENRETYTFEVIVSKVCKDAKNCIAELEKLLEEEKKLNAEIKARFVKCNTCTDEMKDKCLMFSENLCEGERCEELVDLMALVSKNDLQKENEQLKEKNRQLSNEVEDLTAYCNQIGKIKTGVLKLFEHIVAR